MEWVRWWYFALLFSWNVESGRFYTEDLVIGAALGNEVWLWFSGLWRGTYGKGWNFIGNTNFRNSVALGDVFLWIKKILKNYKWNQVDSFIEFVFENWEGVKEGDGMGPHNKDWYLTG